MKEDRDLHILLFCKNNNSKNQVIQLLTYITETLYKRKEELTVNLQAT